MRFSHGILGKFVYFTGLNENHIGKTQNGLVFCFFSWTQNRARHLFAFVFFDHFNVYRDTIAAPGPVSLLSYVEKLITACLMLDINYMADGDTKSHATKYSCGMVRCLRRRTRYQRPGCMHPLLQLKMTKVQILQTADLILLT